MKTKRLLLPKWHNGEVSINVLNPDIKPLWSELHEFLVSQRVKTPIFIAEPVSGLEPVFLLTARDLGLPTITAPTTNLALILNIIQHTRPDAIIGQEDLINIVLETLHKKNLREGIKSCFVLHDSDRDLVRKIENNFQIKVTVDPRPLV